MFQARLNDASIALSQVFSQADVKFGIFGGYAIAVLGGARASKDIDCLASVSKEEAIHILDGKNGFVAVPQTRHDYVAFLWSDQVDRKDSVLVEVFCERYPGAQYSMQKIRPCIHIVNGMRLGNGPAFFLLPFYIFKGKLSAAATRSKFHDSFDLRWLEDRYREVIKVRRDELSLVYIGLALKRFPELEHLFRRIGIDIATATDLAKDLDPENLPPTSTGDVQKGLLG